jgi:hypothetical protein
MDRRLDEGSTPVRAPRLTLADLGPLFAAAFAALGFVALAAAVPTYSLLVVGAGAVVSVILVAGTIRGPRRRLVSSTAPAATPSPRNPPRMSASTRQLQR